MLVAALVFSAFDRHGLTVTADTVATHQAAATCHGHGTPCPQTNANLGHGTPTGQHSPIFCGLALCGPGAISAGVVALTDGPAPKACNVLPASIILAGREPEPGRRPPIFS